MCAGATTLTGTAELSVAAILLSAAWTPLVACKYGQVRIECKYGQVRIKSDMLEMRTVEYQPGCIQEENINLGTEYRNIWGGQRISTPSLSSRPPLESSSTI